MDSVVAERPKRANAGNRMQQIVDAEEDEFYKTAYGGFEDKEEDLDYDGSGADSDAVDSDFSIDEGDCDNKLAKDEATEHGIKRRKKQIKKPKEKYRKPTQEEMLREAKKTEEENTRSLEMYQNLELEKARKQVNESRKSIEGPFIRTISTSFPLIEEIVSDQSTEGESSGDGGNNDKKRWARNFVIFSDERVFNDTFKKSPRPVPRKRNMSPISHHKARYFDPVTQLPFASASTFRSLREAYCKQLELTGDEREEEVAEWKKHRKEKTEQQQQPVDIKVEPEEPEVSSDQPPPTTTETSSSDVN